MGTTLNPHAEAGEGAKHGSNGSNGSSNGSNGSNGSPANIQDLPTEKANELTRGLDTRSAVEIARIINQEDQRVAAAVKKAIPEIAQVIDTVAHSLREGGRLIYIGAGSSGRLAALDACEIPAYFST
ncbi:MAG: hypothetical protein WBE63_04280, partial [Acidobacteriaceae bacterium]